MATPTQRAKYAPPPSPLDDCKCTRASAQKDDIKLTHQYPYYDGDGKRLYSRFRYEVPPTTTHSDGDKTFRYCHHYDRTNPEHVALLYGLPRVIEAIARNAPHIYLCEGEGDCEACWDRSRRYATTTHLATRFPLEVAQHFKGYGGIVYVVVDRDHLDPKHKANFNHEDETKRRDYPGAVSALRRWRAIKKVDPNIRVFFREAIVGKDLRDHLEAGKTVEQLRKLKIADIKARAPQEAGNKSSLRLQLSVADMPEGPGMARFVKALEAKGFLLEKIGPTRYKTNCPHPDHDDHNPSFEFEQGNKGVVMTCESGQCNYGKEGTKQICEFLGIRVYDLFDSSKVKTESGPKPEEHEGGKAYAPDSSDPMEVVRHIEDEFLDENRDVILQHWNDDFWMYNGRHFVKTPDGEIRARLWKRMDREMVTKLVNGEWQPSRWAPSKDKIGNLLDAVRGTYNLNHSVKAGTWLNGTATEGPVVPMANGILQIKGRILEPSSASYFNTWSVPYEYDKAAKCPEWDKFMDQVFGEDPDALRALKQWFGYLISGRTDLQKMLLMTGPPRGGRGTIGRVIKGLIGEESFAGITLSSLATDFGLHKLMSKSVGVIGDSRTALRQGEAQVVVERLLSISGEDELPINRKGKDELSVTLGTRIMAFSNELLGFRDSSNAITGRWIIIQMTKSFEKQEDSALLGRLLKELPGIFNWALDGLDDLNEMGRLLQPESGKESVKNMHDSASPEKEFLEDYCIIGEDKWCYTHELWLMWEAQANSDGRKPGTRNTLPSRLAPVVQRMGGNLTNGRVRPGGPGTKQVRVLKGIALADDSDGPKEKK